MALLAYDLLIWLKLPAVPKPERGSYAKQQRFRFISVAGSVACSGRRLVLRLQAGYAVFSDFVQALTRIRSLGPPERGANPILRPKIGGLRLQLAEHLLRDLGH